MTNKKYELTNESMELTGGVTVYRIKALRDFADVKKGQLGGFIQHEANLSHEGDAWVYGGARVRDKAEIRDNARVSGFAEISECASVCENAYVKGGAKVRGFVRVSGFAIIDEAATIKDKAWITRNTVVRGFATVGALTNLGGSTQVYDNADILIFDVSQSLRSNAVIRGDASIVRPNDILVINSLGSRHDRLTAYFNDQGGIEVTTGCFHGSFSEFKKQVRLTHGSNLYGKQYRAAIAFIKKFFEIGKGVKKS